MDEVNAVAYGCGLILVAIVLSGAILGGVLLAAWNLVLAPVLGVPPLAFWQAGVLAIALTFIGRRFEFSRN
jgi:hypothetical protein